MAGNPYVMDYSGHHYFPAPPKTVWSTLEQLDQFESWWSWLGRLTTEGSGLQAGSVLRGTVSPPVPYRLDVEVTLTRCEPCERIEALVSGDLAGEAHLRMSPEGSGTVTDVNWSLEMLQWPMRLAARVAFPLLRWGHDCVVEATVVSFRRQLQRGGPDRA